MKALAHPVRMDVLELLVTHGGMTASDAAAELGLTPANVSWHLRKLAQHGFVRQATSGPGRRRPWKAVAESLTWGDDAEDMTAATSLQDVAIERELQRLRAALANVDGESEVWRAAMSLHQSQLWLTADEAREIGDQVRELFLTKAVERRIPPTVPPTPGSCRCWRGWCHMGPGKPARLRSRSEGGLRAAWLPAALHRTAGQHGR